MSEQQRLLAPTRPPHRTLRASGGIALSLRASREIERLLTAHGLGNVRSDPLHDLVAAQAERMVAEGLERRTHRRYAVWGDVAAR